MLRNLNIADWLSLYRIITVPLLIAMALLDLRLAFSWLLLSSFVSDMLDGFIARTFNMTSKRGARLDSLGDICSYLVGLFGIIWFEPGFIGQYYPVFIVMIGLYIVQLLLSLWRYRKPSSFHTYLAKLAALALGTFVLYLLFFGFEPWIFYLAVAISILDSLEEIILVFLLPEWRTNVKGIYWVWKSSE